MNTECISLSRVKTSRKPVSNLWLVDVEEVERENTECTSLSSVKRSTKPVCNLWLVVVEEVERERGSALNVDALLA